MTFSYMVLNKVRIHYRCLTFMALPPAFFCVVFESKIKAQAHTRSGTCLINEGDNVQTAVLIAANIHPSVSIFMIYEPGCATR